jgi:hypothetical protein
MCRQPQANGRRTHAERYQSFLVQAGFIIRDRDGVRIVKDQNRLGHPDTVLAKVDPGFALFVPLEAHNFGVRTLRAYVKRRSSPGATASTSEFRHLRKVWY